MNIYLFKTDPNGRVTSGEMLTIEPDKIMCSQENAAEVWDNQSRAVYVNGVFVVNPVLVATADKTQVTAKEAVTVSVQLAGTEEQSVTFNIEGQDIIEAVVAGGTEHTFRFNQPGAYVITVSSLSHGSSLVEITVI